MKAKEQEIVEVEPSDVQMFALTWEDMMLIHKCIKDAMNYHLYAFETMEGQKKVYEEVLKRFKKMKEG